MKKTILMLSVISTMFGVSLPLSATAGAISCHAVFASAPVYKDVHSEVMALGKKYQEVYDKLHDQAHTMDKAQIVSAVKELEVVTEQYLAAAEIPYTTNLKQFYNIRGKGDARVDLTHKIYILSGSEKGDALAQLMHEAASKPEFQKSHLTFVINPLLELGGGRDMLSENRLEYHNVYITPGAIAKDAMGAEMFVRMGIEHAVQYAKIRQKEMTLARVELELEGVRNVQASGLEAYLKSLQLKLAPERAAEFQRLISKGDLSEAYLRKEWQDGLANDFKKVEALIAQIKSANQSVEADLMADPTGRFLNTHYFTRTLTATHHISSFPGKMVFDLTEVLAPASTTDRPAARVVVLGLLRWNKERIAEIETEVALLKAKAKIQ